MNKLITNVSILAALALLVWAFIVGVYPHHDEPFSAFLVVWALATVWVGGVIASKVS